MRRPLFVHVPLYFSKRSIFIRGKGLFPFERRLSHAGAISYEINQCLRLDSISCKLLLKIPANKRANMEPKAAATGDSPKGVGKSAFMHSYWAFQPKANESSTPARPPPPRHRHPVQPLQSRRQHRQWRKQIHCFNTRSD